MKSGLSIEEGESDAVLHGASAADRLASSAKTLSQPVRISILRPDELTEAYQNDWQRIRRSNGALQSPYFHPEFTLAVGRARDDVEIAVAHRGTDVIAFWPYQRVSKSIAEPVGGLLNDFHGPILSVEDPVPMVDLVGAAGLSTWRFHALYPPTAVSSDHLFATRLSPYLDLSQGFEAYRQEAQERASTLRRQGQKTRAMIRDVGKLRLDFESLDFGLLEHLICLKRAKYRHTKVFDVLSVPWCANLLRQVWTTNKNGFRGILSGLWAGRHLVAVHLGMLDGPRLHYWFPIFDPRFARYSPGTQLILEVARNAAQRGVTVVDLSYGDDAFKYKFGSRSWDVGRGQVQQGRTNQIAARCALQSRNLLRDYLFTDFTRRCVRSVLPRFGQREYK